MAKDEIREGDIESLRRKAKEEGRPIKSTTVITPSGKRIHYSDDRGRIKIVGVND
jgi:hypothetical protein